MSIGYLSSYNRELQELNAEYAQLKVMVVGIKHPIVVSDNEGRESEKKWLESVQNHIVEMEVLKIKYLTLAGKIKAELHNFQLREKGGRKEDWEEKISLCISRANELKIRIEEEEALLTRRDE